MVTTLMVSCDQFPLKIFFHLTQVVVAVKIFVG